MCDLIKTEIARSGKERLLSNGIVLTGGGAKLEGLSEYIEAAVGIPATLGEPQGITGIVDKVKDASVAVPVGLMLEDLDRPQAGTSNNDRIGQLFGRAQSLFQGFLNRG